MVRVSKSWLASGLRRVACQRLPSSPELDCVTHEEDCARRVVCRRLLGRDHASQPEPARGVRREFRFHNLLLRAARQCCTLY